MADVRRIYVEKKPGFDVEAKEVLADLRENLSMKGLADVRIINRYDVEGITDEEYEKARCLIFSEPPVDNVYDEEAVINDGKVFAVEFSSENKTKSWLQATKLFGSISTSLGILTFLSSLHPANATTFIFFMLSGSITSVRAWVLAKAPLEISSTPSSIIIDLRS